MITYKDFQFERTDQYNLDLYQFQEKEIVEGGGRGKGPGQKTGKFHKIPVHIGHYSSISGILFKILEMDLEATEVKDFNKKLLEHKKFCEDLFKNKKLFIAESVEPENVLDT